jgi:anti-sigma B factor antagonist
VDNIIVETIQDTKVVYLSGIINALTVPDIQPKLVEMVQTDTQFIIEMSDVELISSMGMLMLLNLQRGTDDYQGNVILGGLSEPVRISLSTMGFSSFFTIFETLEEALEHLHSQIES